LGDILVLWNGNSGGCIWYHHFSEFIYTVDVLELSPRFKVKTYARSLQFVLAWNIHNILCGELTDKIWKFDVIPRALIRFGNLNSDGHNSSITSSYFKK
jgi:hypothetical protein